MSACVRVFLIVSQRLISPPHLEGKEKEKGFYTIEAAIDKIAQEKIIGIGAITTNLDIKRAMKMMAR